jgi:hypothetical protein
MTRSISNWGLPLCAVLLALLYGGYLGRGVDYWDQIVATVLSLVAGIPLALWIDRLIKMREGREQFITDRKYEDEIYDFLLEELQINEKLLKSGRNISMVGFRPLSTEMWDVLKASGDLSYIDDIGILHELSRAYAEILKVKHFEEEALDDWNEFNRTVETESTWKIQSMRAREFDRAVLVAISDAKKAIAERKDELKMLIVKS